MKGAPPSLDQRPLSLGIISRLYGYTLPHARLRNRLLSLVLLRALQLPAITWATARVISGPVARRDVQGTLVGVLGFLALVGVTEFCFVYRARYALELGEAVVHDLRRDIYAHLLRMPVDFFRRTQIGRLIGRITSDVDVVRIGVQDAAFVSLVQGGNFVVSAVLMLFYDWKLFLVVLVMAPILWAVVRTFRVGLSRAYRAQQESFTRVTERLA
ncbi:MAG TPA: ABC transporter ATP-binding protein, partial [Polyangiaceae bacterium]